MAPNPAHRDFKVVVLGEGRVGKTSLILRYVHQVFSETQQATIQASFLKKKLVLGNERVHLAIWDTAGQERFHALGPIYYRDADAALLVYDITDRDSFNRVKNWVKELRKFVQNDNLVLVIAANKQDLARNQQISDQESQEYANSIAAAHFKTSAKAGRGVEPLFLNMTRRLLQQVEQEAEKSRTQARPPGRRNLIIADEVPAAPPKSSCC